MLSVAPQRYDSAFLSHMSQINYRVQVKIEEEWSS